MKVTEFYQDVLKIEQPWIISSVNIEETSKNVNIHLAHPANSQFPCKHCGENCPVYDHNAQRKWRHLDTCDYYTYLFASLPRLNCPNCGICTISPSWSRPNSHFTLDFEAYAVDVLQQTQVVSKSALLLRITVEQLRGIKTKAVERGLDRRRANSSYVVVHICIDEKSLQRGHHYVSILYDGETGAVLEVVEHRTEVAAIEGFKKVGDYVDLEKVEVVTLDMWEAFKNAAKKSVPNAAQVHDRFHLSQYLNKAVDITRRAEHKRLSAQGDDRLKKTKYLWLKNPANLSEAQELLQNELLKDSELKTAQAWQLKEDFKGFFDAKDEKEATSFFKNWSEKVEQSENKRLLSVVKTFKNHWEGLKTYCKYKVSNAMAECINSGIQQVKMKARGFKSAKAFREAILFYFGKLDLYP